MAAPVLSPNSPSAGYISWTAFNIQYLGQSFAIPAGNSNKKYTWWPFNGGAGGALLTSDTFPSTLTDDDLLLFLNRSGIPVNAQAADVLYGDLMVPGSILANAIGAQQITADKIASQVELSSHFLAPTLAGSFDWVTSAPTLTAGTTGSSGGSFAAGKYYWTVDAVLSSGLHTVVSNEVNATLAANGTQALSWTAVTGAASYRVYRTLAAGTDSYGCALVTTTAATSYTDTGSASNPSTTRPDQSRMDLSPTGLKAYDKWNNPKVSIDRQGNATFIGVIGTTFQGTPGFYASSTPSTTGGQPSASTVLELYAGGPTESTISAHPYLDGGVLRTNLTIYNGGAQMDFYESTASLAAPTLYLSYAVNISQSDQTTGATNCSLNLIPTGMIVMAAIANPPVDSGYLTCNGQAVSRSDYSRLFAAIGTTYGAGDGSTTFNVPDLRDRGAVGVSGSKALASTGGAATVTLTTNELPAHSHTTPNHNHPYDVSTSAGTSNATLVRGTSTVANTIAAAYDPNTSGGGTSGSTGSGNAFSTVDPYLALNFWIKT